MITLLIKTYCDSCPMFDPEAIKHTYSSDTEVVCKHRTMCSHIYKQAKKEREEKIE